MTIPVTSNEFKNAMKKIGFTINVDSEVIETNYTNFTFTYTRERNGLYPDCVETTICAWENNINGDATDFISGSFDLDIDGGADTISIWYAES
eukprot:CAMPEP_0114579706 /NCGR_PEP_ID=MMETSP0125-20121206/4065_1 /TAXON_ID=485358 ORGANISM="Aristerostoma sp., Strain ATCC 50986" /NCGR_SAMPLE_ID=MMETSP0125 /ASSEMBLY_ACC=CAM_ASM_000245 /LENGTH=92 /DNA_ID=CAMNT_0001770683 /DNA_START=174 /DNA_END=452 /DNA_ORIENTATION=+